MTVRYYRWDDTSAPTLNNAAGSLVTLLDAVLVNGYGSKAAAGWAIAFTGTNKRVYRAASGVRPYIRFDDTLTTVCQGVRLAEAMTDVDTITSNPCPTTTQISNGTSCIYKSANSTNRPWLVVSNETYFILYIGHDNTTAEGLASTTAKNIYAFGDYFSYLPGDAFNSIFISNISNTAVASSMCDVSASAQALAGHYALRAADQTTLSVQYSKACDARALNLSSFGGTGNFTYPDPITGGLLMSPLYLTQPTQTLVRGKLPGLWAVLHNLPGNPGDTFTGAGALSGKTFLLLDGANSSSARRRIAVEISDTWS